MGNPGAGRRTTPRLAGAAVLALLGPLAAGCGSASDPSPPSGVDELVIPTPSLDPADFVDRVDNPWLPLLPGSRWVYRSTSEDGPERITVTVLEETRVVQGVTATVVHDVVRDAAGRLVEDTYDWFAQDARGNVWYLGEDTTGYDGRRTSTEGSWEAGVDGAQAGLAMPAQPRIGDGYRMEYLPGVAEDEAQVVALDATTTVPYDGFTGLLETRDTTPLEPDVVERKLYARDIGLVREETVAGGEQTGAGGAEVVQLVDYQR